MLGAFSLSAQAALIGVSVPNSSAGTSAAIIGAPSDVLDDFVFNTGMQGFDEAQGVVTSTSHAVDGGGLISAGTQVDSHMIFLNSQGSGALSHFSVVWTFAAPILGIMSDRNGSLETASTFELGAPGTNYPASAFGARGLEGNDGSGTGPFPSDGYALLDPYSLRVGMSVTEPGDWIRVVTASSEVPTPGVLALLAAGLLGIFGVHRRSRS
jgi:hypothetical protein